MRHTNFDSGSPLLLLAAVLGLAACQDRPELPTMPSAEVGETAPAPAVTLAPEDARAARAALDDAVLGLLVDGLGDAAAGRSLRAELARLDAELEIGDVAGAQSTLAAGQARVGGYTGIASGDDRIALAVLGLTLARVGERLAGPAPAAQSGLGPQSRRGSAAGTNHTTPSPFQP